MKKYITGTILFFQVVILTAQDSTVIHKNAILRDAKQLAEAMEEKDWKKVLEFTYPPLVEMTGGEQTLIRQAKLSDQALKQQGFDIKKAELSTPLQELSSGKALISIIPIRLTFEGPLGNLYSESSLLGVSEDEGSTWTFISMTQVDMNQLLQLFPDLPKDLVFPRKRVYQE